MHSSPTTMDVHKVMGKTVQRADMVRGDVDLLSSVLGPCPPVYDFHVYDCKPVPQGMGAAGPHTNRTAGCTSRRVMVWGSHAGDYHVLVCIQYDSQN